MATSIIKSDFKGKVEVTTDGIKTFAQLLNELYGLIDSTKIRPQSVFTMSSNVMHISTIISGTSYEFSVINEINASGIASQYVKIRQIGSIYYFFNGTSASNESSTVPTTGRKICVYY